MELSPIQDIDRDQFARFLAIPGHTRKGQIRRMELTARLLDERLQDRRSRLRSELLAGCATEHTVDELLNERMQPITTQRLAFVDGRFVWIAKKEGPQLRLDSDDPDSVIPNYNVLYVAHGDTVQAPKSLRQLQPRPSHPEAHWLCRGANDMGAGYLNQLVTAAEADVPPGVTAHFGFTFGEEDTGENKKPNRKGSEGAMLLRDEWSDFSQVDCIVSGEIGPLDPLEMEERVMRFITRRCGRMKFRVSIALEQQGEGHGAAADQASAGGALREFMDTLEQWFYHGHNEFETEQQVLPLPRGEGVFKEGVEIGTFRASKKQKITGYGPTNVAYVDFAVKVLPGRTSADMTAKIQALLDNIVKTKAWDTRWHLTPTLQASPHGTSYEGYEMPADHVLTAMTRGILGEITDVVPQEEYGLSAADEDIYAAAMLQAMGATSFAGTDKGIITVPPPRCGGAHGIDEWLEHRSFQEQRLAFILLLTHPDGFQRLAQARLQVLQ